MTDYDVIVIGSGVGGMTGASLLAAKGLKPLVAESHSRPGGYMSSFRREGFVFDSALDCISGVRSTGILGRTLSLLGVDEGLTLFPVDPIRSSMFPEITIDVDSDINAYIERLVSIFPHESDGLRDFFRTAARTYEDVQSCSNIFEQDMGLRRAVSPDILNARKNTYEDLLNSYISDFRLKAILSDRCTFLGLPPSQIAALPMIMLIMSYFMQGAYRPQGGFQTLSDAMAEGIRKKGGSILSGREVTKILHDGKVCRGVRCSNGTEYTSRYIIAGGDYIYFLRQLLGSGYGESADRMLFHPGVSTSFFIVYGAFRGEFTRSSSLGYYPSYDISRFFKPDSAFREDGTIGITVASIEDRLRAPEGYHTIVLHEMVDGKETDLDRRWCAEVAVKKAMRALPELQGRIEIIDTAAPGTLERYTKNHCGAAFGWRQVPGSLTINSHGLKNLYYAGHWSEMGGGVLAAAYSGAKAAADILAREGIRIGR